MNIYFKIELDTASVSNLVEGSFNERVENLKSGYFETILFYKSIHYLEEHLDRLFKSITNCNFEKKSKELKNIILNITKIELKLNKSQNSFRLNLYSNDQNSFYFKISKINENQILNKIKLKFVPNFYNKNDTFYQKKNIEREKYNELIFKDKILHSLIGNNNNEICETTISNIYFVKNNIIYTPPLNSPCLPGIMRGVYLRNLGINETYININDIINFDFAFLTNSLKPIQFVESIDDYFFNYQRYELFLLDIIKNFKVIEDNDLLDYILKFLK